MKTITRVPVLLLGFVLLTATGCGKADHQDKLPVIPPPVVAAPVPPAADAAAITEQLKAFTFEQRAECTALARGLVLQAEADVAALKAGYNAMMATPARRAAMVALDAATAGLKRATDLLDNVSAETWGSVQSGLVTAWQNQVGALEQARANKK
ncbi:MAG: hypothetical protein PSV13_05900 [Lacunisphaera sp.]|nr:hypothetical protein [Lacunisphaera sp.]